VRVEDDVAPEAARRSEAMAILTLESCRRRSSAGRSSGRTAPDAPRPARAQMMARSVWRPRVVDVATAYGLGSASEISVPRAVFDNGERLTKRPSNALSIHVAPRSVPKLERTPGSTASRMVSVLERPTLRNRSLWSLESRRRPTALESEILRLADFWACPQVAVRARLKTYSERE